MDRTESLSQGLQIGEKAVNLHPVIDGFEVLLFTFWMNSFAFPWKEHYFFKYITYLCTQTGLFSISALRSSLSFTALLKQSLTTSWSPWPRTKCFSQRFSTLSLQYYSFSCPSSFIQEIKSFSLLFLCFNNSELTNYVTRVPGQFFGFESCLLWNFILAKKILSFLKYSFMMVKVKPTKKKNWNVVTVTT